MRRIPLGDWYVYASTALGDRCVRTGVRYRRAPGVVLALVRPWWDDGPTKFRRSRHSAGPGGWSMDRRHRAWRVGW